MVVMYLVGKIKVTILGIDNGQSVGSVVRRSGINSGQGDLLVEVVVDRHQYCNVKIMIFTQLFYIIATASLGEMYNHYNRW